MIWLFDQDGSGGAPLLISAGAGDCKVYVTDCTTSTPFQVWDDHNDDNYDHDDNDDGNYYGKEDNREDHHDTDDHCHDYYVAHYWHDDNDQDDDGGWSGRLAVGVRKAVILHVI